MFANELQESSNAASILEMGDGLWTKARGIQRMTDFLKKSCHIIRNHNEYLDLVN